MFSEFYADFDANRAYEMMNLLKIDSNMVLKKLSKGNKEKVQLIMVMSRRAKLYLLDEPIAGVDPAARDYILQTIITNYDEHATILLSTHLISDIEKILLKHMTKKKKTQQKTIPVRKKEKTEEPFRNIDLG